jgi:hypothetical protein
VSKSEKSDNFLVEAVRPKPNGMRLSYFDGFRFGVGLFIATLLMLVILSGLAYALATALHLR